MMTVDEFVERIRRQSAAESQEAVGRQLGVSQVSVSRWLAGERKPSKAVILLAERIWTGPVELDPGLPTSAAGDRAS